MTRAAVAIALLLPAALLAGCAGYEPGPETYLYQYSQLKPEPARFTHCYNATCRSAVETGVTPEEWRAIGAAFQPPPADAAAERERIARAVALWETFVGRRTGTERSRGSTHPSRPLDGFQQDCIDETFNTTSYLAMMRDAGWLRWHRLVYPSSRGFISAGSFPHHAATIEEIADGRRFVVDGWFFDNGQPPVIMPVAAWEKGWSPPRQAAASAGKDE